MVVDCYASADLQGFWGHEKPQDTICATLVTVFLIPFSNCNILWFPKLQTNIHLSNLSYKCVEFFHCIKYLITLKLIIKEVI